MAEEMECECEECEAGIPAWVMTFADLMSLLMTFFVLLLSFSQMDVERFKTIAGSMKMAFGVQREIKAEEVPKGTSIIAQEFSSGKPEPAPINEVRQQTTDETKQTVIFTDAQAVIAEKEAEELKEALKEEIKEGLVEVDAIDKEVMIRIREQGSFGSGRADLHTSFHPVLSRIGKVIAGYEGQVVVAGHTDNIPISTRQFSSNWALSSARATNVVHFLTKQAGIEAARMEIRAHADSRPLVPNTSAENRAKNRRVEIILKNTGAQVEDFDGASDVIEVTEQPVSKDE